MTPRTERLRGRAGVKQRLRRLVAEPLCRLCAERGRITAASVPDHIVPLTRGGTDEDSNIRCLCKPCHDEVTFEQFGHQQRASGGADRHGRPLDPTHPWRRARQGA